MASKKDDLVEVFIPKGYINEEPNLLVSVNGVNYLLAGACAHCGGDPPGAGGAGGARREGGRAAVSAVTREAGLHGSASFYRQEATT